MRPSHQPAVLARRALRMLAPSLGIVAVQLLLFPVPAGIWLRGVVVGGLAGLVALGMALTYRSNRILNFAHADLGTVPVVLVVLLRTTWGWPYAAAAGAGVLAAVLLGAAVELIVIRRFRHAPRLVLTVATLGLAQLLTAAAILLPRAFGEPQLLAPRIDAPFRAELEVGGVIFNANDVVAALLIPGVIAGLAIFLKRSTVGVAVRAGADSGDRALMAGVPVKRLHTVVWAVAALLAFVAIFLRAGILGLPVTSALGFGILLRALAALLIGRLTELGTIFSTSVALGVLELGVGWNTSSPLLIDPILGVIIIVALLARRRQASRSDVTDSSPWRSIDDVRPLAPGLARLPLVRSARLSAVTLVVAAALVLPHMLSVDRSLKASAVLVYAILGLSLVVLTGWSGQISLGQIGFFTLGSCLGAKATADWNLDLSVALLCTAIAGAAAATIVGLPALRLRGLYLAVTTLAFSLAATSYLLNRRFSIARWIPTGRIERPPLFGRIDIDSATRMYFVALALLLVTMMALHGIRNSRTGRALVALRDNEHAAQSYGIDAARTRLTGFALSGAIAAAAGCLFVHHQQAIGEQPYAPAENLTLFTMVVVGGIASPWGAVLGAVLLHGTRWFLPDDWQLIASGAGVLLILLLAPNGLGGLVLRVRELWLSKVAERHGIDAPGLRSGRLSPSQRTLVEPARTVGGRP